MAKSDVEKVLTEFQGVGARDADLATKYMNPEKYIQHNPHVCVPGIDALKPQSILSRCRSLPSSYLLRAVGDRGWLCGHSVEEDVACRQRRLKAFNHLPAKQLGTNPAVKGQRQAVFVSSNDEDASAAVAAVATQLGFAPIELGRLDQGGVPLHVLDGRLGALLSQNLVKLG